MLLQCSVTTFTVHQFPGCLPPNNVIPCHKMGACVNSVSVPCLHSALQEGCSQGEEVEGEVTEETLQEGTQ